MIRQQVTILLASIVILTACSTGTLFEKTIVIEPSGWNQDNFLSFSFPVEDTIGQYEILIYISLGLLKKGFIFGLKRNSMPPARRSDT